MSIGTPSMWEGLVGANEYDGWVSHRRNVYGPPMVFHLPLREPSVWWRAWDRWGRLSMSGLLALALRIWWGVAAGTPTALLFWVIELHPRCVTINRGAFRYCFGVSYIGAWCNGIVTLANGGHMPVLDYTGKGDGIHVALTEASRLVFLSDIIRVGDGWAMASIGDAFIFGGVFLALGLWVCQRVGLYVLPEDETAKRGRLSVGLV